MNPSALEDNLSTDSDADPAAPASRKAESGVRNRFAPMTLRLSTHAPILTIIAVDQESPEYLGTIELNRIYATSRVLTPQRATWRTSAPMYDNYLARASQGVKILSDAISAA